jgi:hypothetical protein
VLLLVADSASLFAYEVVGLSVVGVVSAPSLVGDTNNNVSVLVGLTVWSIALSCVLLLVVDSVSLFANAAMELYSAGVVG